MNNQFLQEIATCYISDNNLPLTKENKDNAFNLLISHRDDILKKTVYYEDLEGSYSRQQLYFYKVLNEEYKLQQEAEILGPGFELVELALIALFGYLTFHPRAIQVAVVKLGEGIKGFIDHIATVKDTGGYKYVKTEYDEIKVAQRILDDKYSLCSSKCGLTEKLQVSDIKLGTAFLNSPNIPDDAKPNDVACVITCTLDYLTSVIAELHKTLVNCNHNFADKNNPDSPVNSINFNANCSEIKSYLKDIIKEFEEIISVIYKDNHKGKNTWKEILDNKITAVMNNQAISKYGPTDANYKSIQIDFDSKVKSSNPTGNFNRTGGGNGKPNFNRNR